MRESIVGGLLIFCLRLGDVPISTLRTMLMVQGRRLPVGLLAVLESTIWVMAISRLLSKGPLTDPFRIAGYSLGFACGTVIGMTLERWLAFGRTLVRVISREHSHTLRERLFEEGYGVTAVTGHGREREVLILFVVTPRRRLRHLMAMLKTADPHAFITHEPVSEAVGGYLPTLGDPEGGKR